MLDPGFAALILNPNAGATPREPDALARLGELLRREGLNTRQFCVPGEEIERTARDQVASGASTIVIAGGDGSVNAAANALVGSDATLAVLPVGTVNHFAKDIGMPLSIVRAAASLASGVARRLDVGSVNGRFFVNNSSIGAYPEWVHLRDQRRAQSTPRGIATVKAAWETYRKLKALSVDMEIDSERFECQTPFVFVGNNEYTGTLFTEHWRQRLDGGKLWLCALAQDRPAQLLRLASRLFVPNAPTADQILIKQGQVVRISISGRRIRVALDGESQKLSTPLTYRSHPRALRVLMPRVA